MSTLETITIDLPYEKPPLNANQRLHWAEEARLKRKLRGDMGWLMKSVRYAIEPLQEGQKLRIQLVYTPASNRRRDTLNLYATLKPLVDGIVDSGIIPDDTPDYVETPEPIIKDKQKKCRHRLQLELTVVK